LGDWLSAISKAYNQMLTYTQIPKEVWESGHDFPVKDHTAVISGAIDGVAAELTDKTQLVGLGLSVVADPKATLDQLGSFVDGLDWTKAGTMVGTLAGSLVGYDHEEFTKGAEYTRHSIGKVGGTLAVSIATGGIILGVLDAPKKLKKLADDLVAVIGRLRTEVKDLVSNFSDNTLQKFALDLKADDSFLEWVNNPDNILSVKGFLAHKDGILTESQKEQLAEMISKGEINHPKAEEWLNRSENIEKFQGNITKGNIFEGNMATELANFNSNAYKGLKDKITDLDDRTILKQVQFCIRNAPDCNAKGDYFIADFVAVVGKTDALGTKYLDAVIVDTKLSQATNFTPNQGVADGLGSLTIRSQSFTPIKGPDLDLQLLKQGGFMKKNGAIKKMWSDGNGNYQNVE
jgi:hypothetical protein